MTRLEIVAQVQQAFGFVPGWMDAMPDAVLDQYWATLSWVLSDTKLAGRDKALVAFGAASAAHCSYWIPFHTAQLALNGLSDESIKEAGWVVQSVTGASAYLYSVGYSGETFKQEVDKAVEHIKKAAQQG